MIQIRPFLKDAEIVFTEMSSVRIIRGIANTQACNYILVVPPNAIINPKKHDMGSLDIPFCHRPTPHPPQHPSSSPGGHHRCRRELLPGGLRGAADEGEHGGAQLRPSVPGPRLPPGLPGPGGLHVPAGRARLLQEVSERGAELCLLPRGT